MTDEKKPRPVPAKKASAKKKSGPSMKEQLMARRQAEEAAGDDGGAKAAPARKAAGSKAARSTSGGAKRSAGARSGGASARRASGGRTRAARADDDASDTRRRLRENRKKSPMPFIAAGILVVGGGAAAFFLTQDKGEEDPNAAGDGTVAAAENEGENAGETAGDGTSTEAPSGESTESTGSGDATSDGDSGGSTDAPAPTSSGSSAGDGSPDENETLSSVKLAVTKVKKSEGDPNDPNNIDITKLSPYEAPPGVSSEDWASLTEDAATFLDPGAGAAGGRAERRLVEAGINGWPAIVNEMLRLDVTRPQDNESGMIAQRALDTIRGGTTGYAFDWRTPEESGTVLEPKQQWVNKYTIVKLHDVWRKHLEDPNYFREKIAKGTVKEEMEGNKPAGEFDDLGGGDLDLGDLDDIGG